MHFHSMVNSLFIQKMIYFLENDLESPLIIIIFFNGKQNKKENPKYGSLFGKIWSMENRVWVWGLGYLLKRYDNDRSTPLNP